MVYHNITSKVIKRNLYEKSCRFFCYGKAESACGVGFRVEFEKSMDDFGRKIPGRNGRSKPRNLVAMTCLLGLDEKRRKTSSMDEKDEKDDFGRKMVWVGSNAKKGDASHVAFP